MKAKRTILIWVISLLMIMLALSFVVQLVDEVGPPILLDPEHRLEIPPPPESMYRMGQESEARPVLPNDSQAPNREARTLSNRESSTE